MSAQPRMSDAELREWARSCLCKVRYYSADNAAKAALKRMRRGAPTLRSYYCAHCGGWHLTKRVKA